MTRHISDQSRGPSVARLREYTRQEREDAPHPAIQLLHRQPKMRGEGNRKMAEYARIERGRAT